jgi:hypothetical protein
VGAECDQHFNGRLPLGYPHSGFRAPQERLYATTRAFDHNPAARGLPVSDGSWNAGLWQLSAETTPHDLPVLVAIGVCSMQCTA